MVFEQVIMSALKNGGNGIPALCCSFLNGICPSLRGVMYNGKEPSSVYGKTGVCVRERERAVVATAFGIDPDFYAVH